MAKKRQKTAKKETVDYLVDTTVEFPDDQKHLVRDGVLVLYFGKETRGMIVEICSELMMSRNLPVDLDSVGIGDLMVLWLAEKRRNEFEEDGSDVILVAKHIYAAQIQETNREAIMLALTAYTDIEGQFNDKGLLIEPSPLKEGKKLFHVDNSGRPSSFFTRLVQKRSEDIPDMKRNLNNPYESRLKWLDDTLTDAGYEFYQRAVKAINSAIMSIIADLPETDDAGFQFEPTDTEMDVPSNAVGKDPAS